MTRLAILADIHGNLPALEAVLADLAQFTVDHVIVAGDVINWGPFSAQVMERVTREGWAVIRGNNEFYLLDYLTPRAPAIWHDAAQWSMLPWLREQLQGRWQSIIAAWPDTLSLCYPDAPPIRVVHGCAHSAWEGITALSTEAEVAEKLAGVAETTVIGAHTHLALDRQVGGRHILNPGSVGVPLEGEFYASYMLLDGDATGWRPTFRRVPLDMQPVLDEFERTRFVERCGVIGHLVVEEFETAQLQLLPFLRWKLTHYPDAPMHANLLHAFTEADVREFIPPAYRLPFSDR